MTNVQLSKFQDFREKKFLVVDDFPEFRTAIKRMVEAFGATNIDTASNGEDAINQIKSKHYDAILCDYNLGDGKDGQQVLEEGKFRGVIKEAQIFLLITAENTAEMVMGALEYEPDDYLVKPFTKEMVHQRLLRTVAKKQDMMEIFKAMQVNEFAKALGLCNEKIKTGGNLLPNYLKTKGKLLLKLGRYEEALKFYTELLAEKSLPWIFMGRGQCYYNFKQYAKALADFEAIVALSQVNVEGYDWIAKAQIAMNNFDMAQSTLENAARLSPKAILRQQNLGDIAFKNKNFEVAEKAYRWAVNLGKHSCYRRTQDYVNYAEILINKCKSDENGRISLRAGNDAVMILESLAAMNNTDRLIQTQANIMLVFANLSINKTDKAKILAKKAADSIEKEHIKLEQQWLTKLGEALLAVGDIDKAKAYGVSVPAGETKPKE